MMRFIPTICCLLLISGDAIAAWAALANVTPETREEYGIEVCVSQSKVEPGTAVIRLPMPEPSKDEFEQIFGRATWLITTSKYVEPMDQGFRVYIWDDVVPEERGLESPIQSIELLEWREDIEGVEVEISKDLMERSYLYIDYQQMVIDGGYYYSIDLSTFVDTDDGDCQTPAPSNFRLDQEHGGSIYEASWSDVESALNSIHPEFNSFSVLEGENGYVQTAGEADRLTVEYRDVQTGSFTHYRIGKKPLSDNMSPVRYSGGFIRVREGEVLTLQDCIAIFRSYFERGEIPSEYHLRKLDDSYL